MGNSSSNYPAVVPASENHVDIENQAPAAEAHEQENPLIVRSGGANAGGELAPLGARDNEGGEQGGGNADEDDDDDEDDGGVYFGRHFLLGAGRADRVGVEHAALRGDLASLLLQGGPMLRLPPLRAAPAVPCRALLRRNSLRLVPASPGSPQQRDSPAESDKKEAKPEPDTRSSASSGGSTSTSSSSERWTLELRYDATCECVLRVWFGPSHDPAAADASAAVPMGGTSELLLPAAVDGLAVLPPHDFNWLRAGDWADPRFPLVLQLSARTPAASAAVDTQTCYVRVTRTEGGALTCRVAAVKIRHRGHTYLLHEIFGGESDAEPSPATSSPAPAALAEPSAAAAPDSATTEPTPAPVAAVAKLLTVDVRGRECVICMTEPRDTTVLPCRHMCVCSSCAEAMRSQTHKCPICRAQVKSLVQIRAPPVEADALSRK